MLPETMRTIEISEPGGPEVLVQGTRPLPEMLAGDILVRTIAAGVNGPDQLQRRGHYPPPKGASDLLGLEVSGEVVAIGSDVSRWRVGDEICALTNGGGYAEYVAIAADQCLPIPSGISTLEAASLPETYFTVWSNCFLDYTPNPGGRLLLHGGAGGIGTAAIQLAKLFDMEVFVTVSNEASAEFCISLGADRAINYKTEDFVEAVREAGNANMIVDIVGGDYVAKNLKAAAPDARIIQLAYRQGSKVDVDLMPIMLKRLTLTGSTLRSRPPEFKARIAADLEARAWPHFKDGKLKTVLHKTFSFDDVVAAHTLMDASQHRGKILITP